MQKDSNGLQELLKLLPPRVREAVIPHADRLVDIVLDLGRAPELRVGEGARPLVLHDLPPVSKADLTYTVALLGARFRADRRAGIEGTLHRISAIQSTRGEVIGITMRAGRHLPGVAEPLRKLLASRRNILVIGPPGSGKTTILRDAARILSVDLERRVVIVDTSGEIGGWGDIPHPAIGRARRIPVPDVTEQYRVMLEAVANHTPDVVIVDEIGQEREVLAVQTIARRGVQFIGTCHGFTLADVVSNPVLAPLVGRIEYVTERGKRGVRGVGVLTGRGTFERVVEVAGRGKYVIYDQVDQAVRAILEGKSPKGREVTVGGNARGPAQDPADNARIVRAAAGSGS